MRDAFTNNISTGIQLTEVQTSKIIQYGPSFGSWLGNSWKRALINVAFHFEKSLTEKYVEKKLRGQTKVHCTSGTEI